MHLPDPRAVKRVGIIGAGTIGASWAAHFLARGMDVQFWDPGPGSESRVPRFVADAWPVGESLSWESYLGGLVSGEPVPTPRRWIRHGVRTWTPMLVMIAPRASSLL